MKTTTQYVVGRRYDDAGDSWACDMEECDMHDTLAGGVHELLNRSLDQGPGEADFLTLLKVEVGGDDEIVSYEPVGHGTIIQELEGYLAR
jgi:hypothetical protein